MSGTRFGGAIPGLGSIGPAARRTIAISVAGTLAVLALWTLVAVVNIFDDAVPTPLAVLRAYREDGWTLYWGNFEPTLQSAAKGFMWGNMIAILLALVVMILPPLEIVATQIAILTYCTPLVAIAPLIAAVFQGRAATVFLAAISVFFTTLVGTLAGLKAADRTSLDLVRAYGGGRTQQVLRVQLISAAPHVLAALKIAAPAAILGAILGEYMGAVNSGVGPFLTASQSSLNAPRTWGVALAAGAAAGLAYGLLSILARLIAPYTSASPRTIGDDLSQATGAPR